MPVGWASWGANSTEAEAETETNRGADPESSPDVGQGQEEEEEEEEKEQKQVHAQEPRPRKSSSEDIPRPPPKSEKKKNKKTATTKLRTPVKTEPGIDESRVVKRTTKKKKTVRTKRVKQERELWAPAPIDEGNNSGHHIAIGELTKSSIRRMARRAGGQRISLAFVVPLVCDDMDREMSKTVKQSLCHMIFSNRKTLTTADSNPANHRIFA